jgi:hypothetical protein
LARAAPGLHHLGAGSVTRPRARIRSVGTSRMNRVQHRARRASCASAEARALLGPRRFASPICSGVESAWRSRPPPRRAQAAARKLARRPQLHGVISPTPSHSGGRARASTAPSPTLGGGKPRAGLQGRARRVGATREWPKVHDWKSCVRATVPRVRTDGPSTHRDAFLAAGLNWIRPKVPRSAGGAAAEHRKESLPLR